MKRLLAALARVVPEPVKRFCRARGWRPGRAALRLVERDYEPDVRHFIRDTVRPGDTCVDVGANEGMHTALMAELVGPSGRVVAYEAHPEIAADLRAFVAGKKWAARVRVVHAAVADGVSPEITLYPGAGGGPAEWTIVGSPPEAAAAPPIRVPTVALDAEFAEGARVDFVKIDAEGAGAAIVAGMRAIIERERPAFFIETHDNAELQAVEGLTALGYRVHRTDGAPPEHPAARTYVQHVVALPPSRPG